MEPPGTSWSKGGRGLFTPTPRYGSLVLTAASLQALPADSMSRYMRANSAQWAVQSVEISY